MMSSQDAGAREALHFPELPTPSSDSSGVLLPLKPLLPRSAGQMGGHQRSASHGGTAATVATASITPAGSAGAVASGMTGGRPSALKRPGSGHQRALSQGQLGSGSRVGSRTEFTLPAGHRDSWAMPLACNTLVQTQTAPSSAGSLFAPGHKRQASRSESIYTVRGGLVGDGPLTRALQLLLRRKPSVIDTKLRAIVPNHLVPNGIDRKHHHPNSQWPSNSIRTTKYTVLSFIPKNLFEQFHRVANLYFIAIVLLNWIPTINAFGKEISMLPVLFVLGVTAIKDLFEDRRRYISDQRINNSFCRVYDGNNDHIACQFMDTSLVKVTFRAERRYRQILWKQVRVGDIVHISNNELVPADLLLLKSSDDCGLCYLDTCNLDGETNLKQRIVPAGILPEGVTMFEPSQFNCVVEVEAPSTKMYRFSGALIKAGGERISVSTEHLLLRESVLKNTDYIEGIVIYAGHETKALLNNGGSRYKRTAIERQMNRDIIWCVVILLVLCLVGGIGCRMWLSSYEPYSSSSSSSTFLHFSTSSNFTSTVPFILVDREPSYEGFLTFLTFVIILQVMIPLSLYVTVEVSKLLQVYHMYQDPLLIDRESGQRIECRALNTTEELGQVQHIFSDKTGTLTENRMIFRRITAGIADYNHPDRESSSRNSDNINLNEQLMTDLKVANRQAAHLQELLLVLALCNTVVVAKQPHHDSMDARGGRISSSSLSLAATQSSPLRLSPLAEDEPSTYQRLCETPSPSPSPSVQPSHRPMTTLLHRLRLQRRRRRRQGRERHPALMKDSALSSPVLLTNKEDKKATEALFEAESPDELALVRLAFEYGVRLKHRAPDRAIIQMPDDSATVEYPVVEMLPFDAIRKKMSIVVRDPHSKRLVLYAKGADTAILSNLSASDKLEVQERVSRVQQHIQLYARQGLRVLLFAKRFLNEADFALWQMKHHEIQTEADVAASTREQRISDSYSRIETGLTLLGATGVEDRLQPAVPESLSRLQSAGICVWVLTGDKAETAINIAYSARLFTHKMDILQLQAKTKAATENAIKSLLAEIHSRSPTIQLDLDGRGVFGGGTGRMVFKKPPSFSNTLRGLVVDSRTLTFILDPRSELQRPFLELARECSSVLCCRATPLQKSMIVRIVKEIMHKRTLAIGDGANDVSMLQSADIGIAVRGAEGRQAVLASDYAIPRFATLTPLLLVHGHWCYDRLSRMVLYFFYKNATFVFLIFWFQLYCGYSAQVMIDQMHLMLYNLVFTSLPPIAIGVYETDAPASLLMQIPSLYRQGRDGQVYQPASFWLVMADSVYQSIAIFFITLGAYNNSTVSLWEFGVTITTSCVFIMLTQVAIDTKSWTIIHVLALIGSLVLYFSFTFLYNGVCDGCLGLPSNYWVIQRAANSSTFWLIILLLLVVALLPRWILICHNRWLKPNETFRAVYEYNQQNKNAMHELLTNSWSTLNSSTSITRSHELATKANSPPALACVG